MYKRTQPATEEPTQMQVSAGTFYVDSYIILQFAGVPVDPAAEKSGSLPHASQHSY
jgi:hypothetical protein